MERPRVLLVDDDEATLQTLAFALRRDFSLWVARSARHAIQVAEELHWDADAIVTDLDLGPGMRGDDFAVYYRGLEKRRTPIVLMTGATDIVGLRGVAGISEVILKPVNIEQLTALLWSLIDRDRPREPRG